MDVGFDLNVIVRSLPYLFGVGMVFSLKLTFLAMIGGLAVGVVLAMMRLSSIRLIALIATGYVNLIRSIPLILVIFWFYFLVPQIAAWIINAKHPVQVGGFTSAVITFALFEAAYYCEIIRAGIRSIPKSQILASSALGMTYWTTMRWIVLPQALRSMTPVLFSRTLVLFQDTALVYVLSLTDFFGAASQIAQRDSRMVEMYLFVAVVYFVMCFGASLAIRALQSRIAVMR